MAAKCLVQNYGKITLFRTLSPLGLTVPELRFGKITSLLYASCVDPAVSMLFSALRYRPVPRFAYITCTCSCVGFVAQQFGKADVYPGLLIERSVRFRPHIDTRGLASSAVQFSYSWPVLNYSTP